MNKLSKIRKSVTNDDASIEENATSFRIINSNLLMLWEKINNPGKIANKKG
jgi:hypothetical protein